jgi:hypothetical protein
MRTKNIMDPKRASIFLESADVVQLDRIRDARGTTRGALLRQAIKLFISSQQNAA